MKRRAFKRALRAKAFWVPWMVLSMLFADLEMNPRCSTRWTHLMSLDPNQVVGQQFDQIPTALADVPWLYFHQLHLLICSLREGENHFEVIHPFSLPSWSQKIIMKEVLIKVNVFYWASPVICKKTAWKVSLEFTTRKTNMTDWKNNNLMYLLLKMVIFHFHIRFLEGIHPFFFLV